VALEHRINIFTEMDCHEDALSDIEKALLSTDFDNKSLLAAKGLRLSYLRRYEEACRVFEQIGFDDLAIAYYHAIVKARFYGRNGAPNEFESVRTRVASLLENENNAWGFYMSASLSAVEENIEDAVKNLAEGVRIWPTSLEQCDFQRRVMHDPAWILFRNDPRVRALFASDNSGAQSEDSS